MHKKDLIIGISAYIIIFIIPFSFLKTYKFSDWEYLPFVESIIGTFMGAGTIAILTAGILIFQKKLDLEHKRNEEVFTNRIQQYKKAVALISKTISDKIINEDELQSIIELYYETALIADEKIQEQYLLIKQRLENEDDNWDEINQEFIKLIRLMSESLGFGSVKNSDTDISSRKALTELQQALVISSGNEVEKIIGDKTNPKNEVIDWINDIFSDFDIDRQEISKTGGLTYYCNNQKYLQIRFLSKSYEIHTPRIYFNDNEFDYVIPEYDNNKNLIFSDIREYSPNKSVSYTKPWGYQFFSIKFDYKNLDKTEKQILEKIFQEGYKTIMNDKKLSVKSHAELSNIFVKGDNAKAKAWSIKSIDKLISN